MRSWTSIRQASTSTASTTATLPTKDDKAVSTALSVHVMTHLPAPPNAVAGPSSPPPTPRPMVNTRFNPNDDRSTGLMRMIRAIRRAVIPASAPSESAGTGTDLEVSSSSFSALYLCSMTVTESAIISCTLLSVKRRPSHEENSFQTFDHRRRHGTGRETTGERSRRIR